MFTSLNQPSRASNFVVLAPVIGTKSYLIRRRISCKFMHFGYENNWVRLHRGVPCYCHFKRAPFSRQSIKKIIRWKVLHLHDTELRAKFFRELFWNSANYLSPPIDYAPLDPLDKLLASLTHTRVGKNSQKFSQPTCDVLFVPSFSVFLLFARQFSLKRWTERCYNSRAPLLLRVSPPVHLWKGFKRQKISLER